MNNNSENFDDLEIIMNDTEAIGRGAQVNTPVALLHIAKTYL